MTVKIRSGCASGDEAGRRLAPRLVAAGAAAICLHPRSAGQLYRGPADHAVTLALAGELPVPVIASGDIAAVGHRRRGPTAPRAPGCSTAAWPPSWWRAPRWGGPWVFAELLEGEGAPPLDERRRALALFVDEAGPTWARAPSATCAASGRAFGAAARSTQTSPPASWRPPISRLFCGSYGQNERRPPGAPASGHDRRKPYNTLLSGPAVAAARSS